LGRNGEDGWFMNRNVDFRDLALSDEYNGDLFRLFVGYNIQVMNR